MTDLTFSGDEWPQWEAAISRKLANSGFNSEAIAWICGDLGARWKRLPPDRPIAIATREETADAVRSAAHNVNQAKNETLMEFVNMVLDLEIDLFYALHPPTGGTRLRLAA